MLKEIMLESDFLIWLQHMEHNIHDESKHYLKSEKNFLQSVYSSLSESQVEDYQMELFREKQIFSVLCKDRELYILIPKLLDVAPKQWNEILLYITLHFLSNR